MTAVATPQQSSFDFKNPFMAATIVAQDGTKYPLWMTGNQGASIDIPTLDPGVNDLKALSFMTELVVTMDLGRIPSIDITLSPPFLDAIRLLDSSIVEIGTNSIQAQFGYASGAQDNGNLGPLLSPIYQGLMIPLPDISIGTDTTIVIHARCTKDITHDQLQLATPMPAMTIKDIITKLLIPELVPDFSNVKGGSTSDQLLNKTITYNPSWGTPEACVADLARQARCRVIYSYAPGSQPTAVSDGTVYFYPIDLDATNTADFTLAMFGYDQGVLGGAVYPIISCSTSTTSLWLPGIRSIILTEIDEITKKHSAAVISDAGKADPSGALKEQAIAAQTPRNSPAGVGMKPGQAFYPDPSISNLANFVKKSGDPSDPSAVQQAQSAFDVMSRAQGVGLTVETVGIPNVFPGMIAAVQGLGIRLSTTDEGSTYSIRKVTHVLNSSGYTTTLEMTSNVGSFISKQIQLNAAGPDNTSPAPTDNAANDTVEK